MAMKKRSISEAGVDYTESLTVDKYVVSSMPVPVGKYINPNAERFVKDLFQSETVEVNKKWRWIVFNGDLANRKDWAWVNPKQINCITLNEFGVEQDENLGSAGVFTFDVALRLVEAHQAQK